MSPCFVSPMDRPTAGVGRPAAAHVAVAEPAETHRATPPTGDTGWVWQNPKPAGTPLYTINCPSATVCFAGGFGGRLTETTDGGVTWTSPQTGTSASINGISCASPTACVAVGDQGLALRTTDGGGTWSTSRINNGNFLSSVSCASALVCFAAGGSGAILTSANGGMSWSAQASGTSSDLFGISCPNATTCFAVGANGVIATTTDGGASWSLNQLGNPAWFSGISCATVTTCAALQFSYVVTTTNGGTSWSSVYGGQTILNGISCPSAGRCFAGANDGSVYIGFNSFGASSTQERGGLFGVSCPTAAQCFAAGDYGMVVATSDGGSVWSQQASGTAAQLNAISCPSVTTCAAVGAGGVAVTTTDGGSTWTNQSSSPPAAGNHNLSGVNCPSTTTCFAVGSGGVIIDTTGGLASWAAQSSGITADLLAISCPTTASCIAVGAGGVITATTNGGATWNLQTSGTTQSLLGVSCPNASTCYAVDGAGSAGHVFATTNGGTSWALQFTAAVYLDAINCPSVSVCYGGGLGYVLTTDGGASWTTSYFSSNPIGWATASCPSASVCYALSGSILHTVNYGGSWDTEFPSVATSLSGISCPGPTTCFAVGYAGTIVATTSGGSAWTKQIPTISSDIQRLSCPNASTCYAAALDTILVTHDGGATWGSHAVSSPNLVGGISCPAVNTCFAVGRPGAIYFTADGGSTWSPQANPLSGSSQTLEGVSCASVVFCVAVGTGGLVLLTSNGSTWTAETSGTTNVLWSVSCPSTALCVAVGDAGALTRTAGSWHGPIAAASSRDVSCPSVSTCYAVGGGSGAVKTSDGGASWSQLYSPSGVAISCPLVTACMTVGDRGSVLLTTDGGAVEPSGVSDWSAVPMPTTNGLLAVAFLDSSHAFVGGRGGTILANLSPSPKCTGASLASDQGYPGSGSFTVTFNVSASGPGCLSPIFKFVLWSPATGWVTLRDYSPGSVFVFYYQVWAHPAFLGLKPGTYTMDVWVEQAGSPAGTGGYETYALGSVGEGCQSATLTPNPAPTTGIVTFTAFATGPTCTPMYQFWLWSPASGWVLEQPYSSTNTWSIDASALANTTYSVDVWVENIGSPVPYETWALSTIPKGACGVTTVNATRATPQSVGGTINFATTAPGCTAAQYRYWIFPGQSANWQMLRDYSVDGTYNWNTAGWMPGTQSIVVHVRQSGSTAAYDTDGLLAFSLLGCSLPSMTAGPISPQPAGSAVQITAASPSCASPLYQFWVYPPGGPWTMVQDFSPNATFNWSTSSTPPGTYAWVVYVKQQGSGNSYDSFALVSDTLT